MAGDALQRSIARLLVVRACGARRGAPGVRCWLYGLHAFSVHGAVALHAPAHGQLRPRHRHGGQVHRVVDDVLSRLRVHLLHGLDAAVARLAHEPRLDVFLVRELRVLRNPEHADPRYGLLLFPEAVELLHLLVALGGHDLVAAHALFHRRNPRIAAAPRIGVAVLAGDLIGARVNDVAEEDRLYRPFPLRSDGQNLGRIVRRLRQCPDVLDDLSDLAVAQLRLERRHERGESHRLRTIRDGPMQELVGYGVRDRAHREVLGFDSEVGPAWSIAPARLPMARGAVLAE